MFKDVDSVIPKNEQEEEEEGDDHVQSRIPESSFVKDALFKDAVLQRLDIIIDLLNIDISLIDDRLDTLEAHIDGININQSNLLGLFRFYNKHNITKDELDLIGKDFQEEIDNE